VLLLSFLLTGDRLRLALAGSSVGPRSLASGWETAPVPETAVAADLHEAADIALDLSLEVAFYLVFPVQQLSELTDLSLIQIPNLGSGVNAGLLQKPVYVVLADAIKQRKSI
jgi:hypothetical protein